MRTPPWLRAPRRSGTLTAARNPRRARPGVEALEDRAVPAVVPVGPEFRVNPEPAGSQTTSDGTSNQRQVAMDSAGNFVVVWTDTREGGIPDVYAQRYSAAGQPLGTEFRVNSTTVQVQKLPVVAMDAAGNFVVAWVNDVLNEIREDVYAQRYNAAGEPLGGEFRVNTSTMGPQYMPALAMDAAGNFVVAWTSGTGGGAEIYARRYNAAGQSLGNEFLVNSYTFNDQYFPAVAMDADGDFVVAWVRIGSGSHHDVVAQRFSAAGQPVGPEFLVNTTTDLGQEQPDVAMDAAGNFLIAWQGYSPGSPQTAVSAQRYNAAGEPLGSEFRVNTDTQYDQVHPSVAADAQGNFVVTWCNIGPGVFGQRYTPAGVPLDGEFQVNTYQGFGFRTFPSVVAGPNGNFVVAWTSSFQDGDGEGVYAQRFATDTAPPDLTVTPAAGDEAAPVPLDVRASLVDPDGTETLSITIRDVPNGVTLSAGTANADGSWSLTPDQLPGLTLLAPDNLTFTLTVVATATESDGSTASATAPLPVTVANRPPAAGVAGPGTVAAGQQATFSLTATDPAAVDQAAGFTYRIDWDGDGTVDQTVTGLTGTQVLHAFPAAGSFTVRVTAMDKDGGVSGVTTLPVTVQPGSTDIVIEPRGDDLAILGTPGPDVIIVMQAANPALLRLSLNGRIVEVPRPVGRVLVDAGDGNDAVIPTTLATPVWSDGGPGDDVLWASNGGGVLRGGAGNDVLFGRGGREILIGGGGADVLFGGGGDDLLIGGFTAFDGNEGALGGLFAEWNSGRDYLTRVANLRGTGTGDRLNGESFLWAAGAATVFDDDAVDVVFGQGGRDWFLGNIDAGVVDILLDRAGDELIDDVSPFGGP